MNIDGLDDPQDDDDPQGDPQDAHLGRAAEVQDENWDEAQSSASSKWGGYHDPKCHRYND